jgi:hypothetical protein
MGPGSGSGGEEDESWREYPPWLQAAVRAENDDDKNVKVVDADDFGGARAARWRGAWEGEG